MVYIVVQTKGGVGKSTIATNVMNILIGGNLEDIKIVEIDNHNNTSELYSNSVLKNNMKTIKVSSADDELDDIFFEALANKTNIIIDIGGGDDSDRLLTMLKNQPSNNIRYIVPFQMGGDDQGAYDTIMKIGDVSKCLVVLNGYMEKEKIKKDFLWFFGDQDVKGLQQKIKGIKYITIPFDPIFTKAKLIYKMTITDLAEKSKAFATPDEASDYFLKEAGADSEAYSKLYRMYKLSLLAAELVKKIAIEVKEIK